MPAFVCWHIFSLKMASLKLDRDVRLLSTPQLALGGKETQTMLKGCLSWTWVQETSIRKEALSSHLVDVAIHVRVLLCVGGMSSAYVSFLLL